MYVYDQMGICYYSIGEIDKVLAAYYVTPKSIYSGELLSPKVHQRRCTKLG